MKPRDGTNQAKAVEGTRKEKTKKSRKESKKRSLEALSSEEHREPSKRKREKATWTADEEQKLVELVQLHGERCWKVIAETFGNKSGKQCREKWNYKLSPTISNDPWTNSEEEIFVRAHRIYGNKWAAIAHCLEGRSDNAVKNHWNAVMHRKNTRFSLKSETTVLRNYILELKGEPQEVPFPSEQTLADSRPAGKTPADKQPPAGRPTHDAPADRAPIEENIPNVHPLSFPREERLHDAGGSGPINWIYNLPLPPRTIPHNPLHGEPEAQYGHWRRTPHGITLYSGEPGVFLPVTYPIPLSASHRPPSYNARDSQFQQLWYENGMSCPADQYPLMGYRRG